MTYMVHQRRLKIYDASRSSAELESQFGKRTTGTGLVKRVISHERDLITGYLEFLIEFATGHISQLPWEEVRKLDLVARYIKEHNLDPTKLSKAHLDLWRRDIDPATNAKAKRRCP